MAMTATDRTLRKLVTLKRQKAEQDFQALLLAQRRMDQEIAALTDSLQALNAEGIDFHARQLSHQQHFTENTLARIDTLKAERAALDPRLHDARHALKKAIHSEEQLSQPG